MSASTVPSSSDGQRSTSQSLTRQMHSDMNVYDMPPSIYRDLCIVLDSQDLWANVAYQMGYTKKDIDVIISINFFFISIFRQFFMNSIKF